MQNEAARVSTLGFAILGLVKMQPATGYGLRGIFQETPMAGYSSSPGAIYPALKNLESDGLVRIRDGIGKTGRQTQTYYCTPRGTSELLKWLRAEVTTDAVYRELDVVMLRFSYLDLVGDLSWSIEFLDQFERAARQCAERLQALKKEMESFQPLHGQLALLGGVQIFNAHAEWAQEALLAVKQKQRTKP